MRPGLCGVTGALRWALTVVSVLALVVVSSPASAETLVNGKVVKTTADKIIAERQLVCTYGKTRFESDPKGRTVVILGKVCTEVSR